MLRMKLFLKLCLELKRALDGSTLVVRFRCFFIMTSYAASFAPTNNRTTTPTAIPSHSLIFYLLQSEKKSFTLYSVLLVWLAPITSLGFTWKKFRERLVEPSIPTHSGKKCCKDNWRGVLLNSMALNTPMRKQPSIVFSKLSNYVVA